MLAHLIFVLIYGKKEFNCEEINARFDRCGPYDYVLCNMFCFWEDTFLFTFDEAVVLNKDGYYLFNSSHILLWYISPNSCVFENKLCVLIIR